MLLRRQVIEPGLLHGGPLRPWRIEYSSRGRRLRCKTFPPEHIPSWTFVPVSYIGKLVQARYMVFCAHALQANGDVLDLRKQAGKRPGEGSVRRGNV